MNCRPEIYPRFVSQLRRHSGRWRRDAAEKTRRAEETVPLPPPINAVAFLMLRSVRQMEQQIFKTMITFKWELS